MKLRAGEDFELPELGGEAIEPRLFVSTYHDTADHRLAPPRRHAPAPGRERQGALAAEAAGTGSRGSSSRSRGRPPRRRPSCSRLLVGHLRQRRAATPIARLRTRREGVRADGAEIVHDTVAVLDHQRVTRSFDELEVELLDGDEKTLRRIEKALRRAGAADGETPPEGLPGARPRLSARAGRAAGGRLVRRRPCARTSASKRTASWRTTPVRGSAPTPRSCIRCAWRRDGYAPSCGPDATCSIPRGRSRSGRSCGGSAARSARSATSTS